MGGCSATETIGYIVMEAGAVMLGTQTVEAGLSADTILGADDTAPFAIAIGLPDGTSVMSSAGMDGGNGGWPAHQQAPSGTALAVFIDEDQAGDAERHHTTEQAAYLVISN